jgi:hypothetical protein
MLYDNPERASLRLGELPVIAYELPTIHFCYKPVENSEGMERLIGLPASLVE